MELWSTAPQTLKSSVLHKVLEDLHLDEAVPKLWEALQVPEQISNTCSICQGMGFNPGL